MLRSLFNFLLYSSIYISVCAILMIWQTNVLLDLRYDQTTFYLFVFFSTICSYNFHWYLTPNTYSGSQRLYWGDRHRAMMLVFFVLGMLASIYFFWQLRQHWLAVCGSVVLTFLYSAPKIPHRSFRWLSKIAIGKTLFLTGVWTYVTTLLPALVADGPLSWALALFVVYRFCLIYAICILFDYRDLESDKKEGIRTLITYLNEEQLMRLYYFSLVLATITACLMGLMTSVLGVITLLIPVLATALVTKIAQRSASDYLYYFVLDGFMALSAFIHLLLLLF